MVWLYLEILHKGAYIPFNSCQDTPLARVAWLLCLYWQGRPVLLTRAHTHTLTCHHFGNKIVCPTYVTSVYYGVTFGNTVCSQYPVHYRIENSFLQNNKDLSEKETVSPMPPLLYFVPQRQCRCGGPCHNSFFVQRRSGSHLRCQIGQE